MSAGAARAVAPRRSSTPTSSSSPNWVPAGSAGSPRPPCRSATTRSGPMTVAPSPSVWGCGSPVSPMAAPPFAAASANRRFEVGRNSSQDRSFDLPTDNGNSTPPAGIPACDPVGALRAAPLLASSAGGGSLWLVPGFQAPIVVNDVAVDPPIDLGPVEAPVDPTTTTTTTAEPPQPPTAVSNDNPTATTTTTTRHPTRRPPRPRRRPRRRPIRRHHHRTTTTADERLTAVGSESHHG